MAVCVLGSELLGTRTIPGVRVRVVLAMLQASNWNLGFQDLSARVDAAVQILRSLQEKRLQCKDVQWHERRAPVAKKVAVCSHTSVCG
jgi:hypothetical protein